MAVIFNPKFLNQDQQVGKNKVDIKKLKSQVAFICNTQIVLPEDATSVLREDTDVGIKPIENSVILSRNGNVYKIEGTSEDQTILYLKFYASLVGPTGATGPQGEQGEPGTQGPTGATGPQGEQGVQGPAGPQGQPGPQGEQGIQGNTGPQGPKGDTGPRGIQGIQGVKGETGATGPQGPQGLQGPQGIQGPKGDKGDAGNSFVVTGSVVSANDLPPASTTPTGTAYFVGGTYPRPVYVVVESEGVKIWQNEGTLQGPEGPQGPTGPQGPQGATGPTGATGPQGKQGEQGVQGPQGDDGEGFNFMGQWVASQQYYKNDVTTYVVNGNRSAYVCILDVLSSTIPPNDSSHWQPFVTGQKGDTGSQGPQGIQGEQGIQGPQGPTGQTGQTGATGPQGPKGPQGDSGILNYVDNYFEGGNGQCVKRMTYDPVTKTLSQYKCGIVNSINSKAGDITIVQLANWLTTCVGTPSGNSSFMVKFKVWNNSTLIICGGKSSRIKDNSTTTITFPDSFPSGVKPFIATSTEYRDDGAYIGTYCIVEDSINNSNFKVYSRGNKGGGRIVHYIAIALVTT